MKIKSELIYIAVATGIGLLGLGYGLGKRKKLNDISDKLDRTIDDLDSTVIVDVRDEIIKAAAERAANREAERAVRQIRADIRDQISDLVEKEVTSQKKKVEELVEADIVAQVSKIDIDDLKRDVVKQAKKAVTKKLDGSMDDILEEFKSNLENITKAYQAFSEAIPKPNKGINLTFG